MLKIRLQKIGKKNAPSYRIVLDEHTTSPQGKFIEILGTYNPRMKKKNFKKERIEYWLTKGAQASPTVHNLLVDEKIIDKEKVKAWKPKKKISEEKPVVSVVQKTEAVPEVAKAEEPIKVEEQKIEEPKTEEVKPTEEPRAQENLTIDTQEKKE